MKINEVKQGETTNSRPGRFSPKFPEISEEKLDEGPCDVATKSDIEEMTAQQYVKYTNWKKDCEESEEKNSSADDEAELDKMFDDKSPDEEDTPKYKKHLAGMKKKIGAMFTKNSPISAADRVIAKRDKIMGKPKEAAESAEDSNDYAKGDLVVINGRSYILDEYEDGIWWATDNDGGDIEFTPGDEDHHEVVGESPDEEDWDNDVTKTLRKIVDEHQAQKVKFDNGKKTTIDMFTASAVIQGLEAMRPDLQVKAADFINKSPGHLVKFSEMVFGSQKEGYGESVDPVGLSLNVMREAFAEYEKDSSVRWNNYSNYRGLRQKMAHVASRIEEGQMKQLSMDLDDKEMSDEDFKKKYNSSRADMKKSLAGHAPV
jgi:hypothetical protein